MPDCPRSEARSPHSFAANASLMLNVVDITIAKVIAAAESRECGLFHYGACMELEFKDIGRYCVEKIKKTMKLSKTA